MNETRLYKKSVRRVDKLKIFLVHLAIFVLVNTGLFVLNVRMSPQEFWFYWVVFGWGIVLLFHAVSVFGFADSLIENWRERKVEGEIEQEKKEESEGKDP